MFEWFRDMISRMSDEQVHLNTCERLWEDFGLMKVDQLNWPWSVTYVIHISRGWLVRKSASRLSTQIYPAMGTLMASVFPCDFPILQLPWLIVVQFLFLEIAFLDFAMADTPAAAAAPARDSHSDVPQAHDPIPRPNSMPVTTDPAKQTKHRGKPVYFPKPVPRTLPHHSPFFGVFRTAYEKADASLVSESLRSWSERYSHAEPEAILFGPPGTTGTLFSSLGQLDHDTARRIEIVRRGARAAGWDVFFASAKAVWSGPSSSKLHARVLHRPWPDYHAESALSEHFRRPESTSSFFNVEVLSVYDLDGEPIVPFWTCNHNAARFSLLQTVQGLIHDELFRTQPNEETLPYSGSQCFYQKWVRQWWHADVSLGRAECLPVC